MIVHEQNRARLQHWPHSMLATSSHDTKRGEDTRARINVLSEFPGEWREAIERWWVVDWEHDAPQGQVNAVFLVTNDAWELLGLRPVLGVVYLVRDDRLLLERVYSGGHEARRELRPFLLWASAERPRDLAAVWREGRPVRDPEAAAALLELLRAWKANREPLADGRESSQG